MLDSDGLGGGLCGLCVLGGGLRWFRRRIMLDYAGLCGGLMIMMVLGVGCSQEEFTTQLIRKKTFHSDTPKEQSTLHIQ